jgi:hypothetical protein
MYKPADTVAIESRGEFLPVVASHNKQVPGRGSPIGQRGEFQPGSVQAAKVQSGHPLPSSVPFIQATELDAEESGLEFIQS